MAVQLSEDDVLMIVTALRTQASALRRLSHTYYASRLNKLGDLRREDARRMEELAEAMILADKTTIEGAHLNG